MQVKLVEAHPSGLYCCLFQGGYSNADNFCCSSTIVVTQYMGANFTFCLLDVMLSLWPSSSKTLLSVFFLLVLFY